MIKAILKNLGTIGLVFGAITVYITYILNLPYYEYVEKSYGLSENKKSKAIIIQVWIVPILIVCTFLLSFNKDILNHLEKIITKNNYILGVFEDVFEDILKIKNIYIVSSISLILMIAINFIIKNSKLSLLEDGKLKWFNIKNKWFSCIGRLISVVLPVLNILFVIKFYFNGIGKYHLSYIIIGILTFINITTSIIMYESFLICNQLSKLQFNTVYLEDKQPIKCKIIYMNKGNICLYTDNKKITLFNINNVYKVE